MRPYGNQIVCEFINCRADLNDEKALSEMVRVGINKCRLGFIKVVHHKFTPIGVTIIAIISESHVAVHTFPEAKHASIDIYTCSKTPEPTNALLEYFKSVLKPSSTRVIRIKRGDELEINDTNWMISYGSIGTETRYHIKDRIFSGHSKYQKIDIILNDSFGKMLFLDDDVQIAEIGDDEYNDALVSPIVEKKLLNKVAILGGGDGGVAKELLKYNAKDIYLIDIDEMVVTACKEHLPSICGNAFEDKRVNVIIDDANNFLEKYQGFDAIIYDLTLHPEWLTVKDRNKFLRDIFAKIAKNLNKDGIVSIQCCDVYDVETINMLKDILRRNFKKINFVPVFIRPFCVEWMFANATKK